MFGLASATALVLYALRQNINLFYTPQKLLANNLPYGTRVRVGGMVRNGSLSYSDNLNVKFIITDYAQDLEIIYNGILPDLFREGQGVVALGVLGKDHVFKAEQILAKHDEKYMPPELANVT